MDFLGAFTKTNSRQISFFYSQSAIINSCKLCPDLADKRIRAKISTLKIQHVFFLFLNRTSQRRLRAWL